MLSSKFYSYTLQQRPIVCLLHNSIISFSSHIVMASSLPWTKVKSSCAVARDPGGGAVGEAFEKRSGAWKRLISDSQGISGQRTLREASRANTLGLW